VRRFPGIPLNDGDDQSGGPSIMYAESTADQLLLAAVANCTGFKPEKSRDLIRIGAVWTYMSLNNQSKWRRCRPGDLSLFAPAKLRVHVRPRRFPACYVVDWESRLLKVRSLSSRCAPKHERRY
jgi:hypothetical protein